MSALEDIEYVEQEITDPRKMQDALAGARNAVAEAIDILNTAFNEAHEILVLSKAPPEASAGPAIQAKAEFVKNQIDDALRKLRE